MGERGRHEAKDGPAGPRSFLAGRTGVAFDEVQRIMHRNLVRLLDQRCDVRVGDRHKVDTDLTGRRSGRSQPPSGCADATL